MKLIDWLYGKKPEKKAPPDVVESLVMLHYALLMDSGHAGRVTVTLPKGAYYRLQYLARSQANYAMADVGLPESLFVMGRIEVRCGS